MNRRSLAWLCWEACDGDGLLALDLALGYLMLGELLCRGVRLVDGRYVVSKSPWRVA